MVLFSYYYYPCNVCFVFFYHLNHNFKMED